MDSVLPFRRFASWVIDRLLFLGVGAAILYVIHVLDNWLGISGPQSVNFDVYDFFAIQMPLAVVITYAIWLLIIIKIGPPGRVLTRTEVRRHRGGSAGQPRKLVRAVAKIGLHLTLIGLIVDAIFILRDQRERRSIPDILAGTMVTPRRR
jgi:hypothetical protein